MKKNNEMINYDKFFNLKYNNNAFNNEKIFFTIFIIVEKINDINLNTIYSVLNQTLINFEFIFIVNKKNKNNLEKFFEKNNLKDLRIKIVIESSNDFKEKIINSKSLYFVQVYFDTFLERTFLETIYINASINNNIDIFFTNASPHSDCVAVQSYSL